MFERVYNLDICLITEDWTSSCLQKYSMAILRFLTLCELCPTARGGITQPWNWNFCLTLELSYLNDVWGDPWSWLTLASEEARMLCRIPRMLRRVRATTEIYIQYRKYPMKWTTLREFRERIFWYFDSFLKPYTDPWESPWKVATAQPRPDGNSCNSAAWSTNYPRGRYFFGTWVML